jgi:hypothetical protein
MENLGGACHKGEIREIEFGHVAGVNDAAFGQGDGDAVSGRLDVDEGASMGKKGLVLPVSAMLPQWQQRWRLGQQS